MRMVLVWVLGLAWGAGCLLSPPIPIGGGGMSAGQRQARTLSKMLPAQLAAASRWKGEVRVAKLRVWADTEYRAQNVRWQHTFEDELDYANQVMTPMLGVRLEAEYQSWDHHAPSGTLSDHLAALDAHDPGDEVVWVVGLTSSLSLVSATFEQLGIAQVGGRHLVLRGYADLEERAAFERAFPDTNRQERELVHEARRRHKTTTVLLHELAHSLGALHETEPDWIMSQAYSHLAASIGDANRELMLITLDDRLKPPAQRDPRRVAEQQLAVLEGEARGWSADERGELIERLRGAGGGTPGGRDHGLDPGRGLDAVRAGRAAARERRPPRRPGRARAAPRGISGARADPPARLQGGARARRRPRTPRRSRPATGPSSCRPAPSRRSRSPRSGWPRATPPARGRCWPAPRRGSRPSRPTRPPPSGWRSPGIIARPTP